MIKWFWKPHHRLERRFGDFVAFGARAIEDGQSPKYLNSSDSMIYNKSKLLYGLYTAKDAIKEQDSVVLMEGYFDVISAQAHGIENVWVEDISSITYHNHKTVHDKLWEKKANARMDCQVGGGHCEADWEKLVPHFMYYLWRE